jgi:RNA polymerase sigma factor (sigma-70 family)
MLQAEVELLVLSAQQNNSVAMEQLVKHFHPMLLRFAIRLTQNSANAQDVVQDVWIKTAKNIRQLRDPRAFKSWIFRAVRWQVADFFRSNKVVQELISHETPVKLDEQALNHQMLSKAINQLNPDDAQVIHLFYLAEMTLQEIANVMEIPVGTVKSKLYRSRAALKAVFESNTLENQS